MPSTNKLNTSRCHVQKHIAKFLYTFLVFASFSVITTLLATLAGTSNPLFGSNLAYATGNAGNSNTVTATLPGSVAIRLLDSTATTEISSLDFNLTPTPPTSFNPSTSSASQSMIVDVATSNPTGYKLYMQSDYKDSNNNYTNSLVHTTNHVPDSDIADTIPTYVPGSSQSGSGTNTLYWNYINPLTNAGIEDPSSKVASTIPAYGNPDKLDQYFATTNSRQTAVSFNVSVDTTIVSGTYENQLLFSAVGNPTTLNYSVTYDMDGGEPQIAKQEDTAAAGSASITIPSTIPTKADHAFSHWQIVIPTGSTATASCMVTANSTDSGSGIGTTRNGICYPGDNVVIHSGIDSEGDFEGDIILKAIYDATYVYTITYNCDGGTGCPENTTYGPTTDTTYNYTIPSATITKQGYAFTNFSGSDSQSYDIGDTITLDSSNTSITLTAKYDIHDITIISNMQDMTSELCSNTIMGTSATLTDARDNNTYTVKKLKDGNCWMTQNLNYLPTVGTTMTSADTDINSSITLSSDSSSAYYLTDNCNKSNVDKFCLATAGSAEYGVHYNWYAATASSGTSGTEPPSIAMYSICPKGWKLPSSGVLGETQALYNRYGSYRSMLDLSGPAFVLGGIRRDSEIDAFGTRGLYWTNAPEEDSTNGMSAFSFNFESDNGSVVPATGGMKYYGRTLRCLAKITESYTLAVNPNGGTWEGSSDTQSFTQQYNTTKSISNPVSTYTITYNDGGQGATYASSPASIEKQFYWSLSGGGTYSGGTYQYGSGDAILLAQYDRVSKSFTLPTITKSGYTCGWTANGASYASEQTGITISEDTTFTATCTSTAFDNITTMQQMTPEICDNSPVGSTTTLTDTRDNNSYTVKKLNDGNCWMTQNLRLTGRSAAFTQADSQVSPSGFTMPTSASDPSPWCMTADSSCIDQVKYLDTGNSEYGVYYNWHTATAGSGIYDTTTSADYSICPKGWRLPTGGTTGEIKNLYGYYFSYDLMTNYSGPHYIMSGNHYDQGTTGQGSYGFFWSKTAAEDKRVYYINFYKGSNYVDPLNHNGKYYGFSVRCIANDMKGGTLTVDPNGGTWEGSADPQTFTQDSGTTKTISNPISAETYTITYDGNGQGASYAGSPTSASKAVRWSLSGHGSYSGGVYQFGVGDGVLIAQYDSASSEFTLPIITKSGSTCGWMADGASYASGQSGVIINSDTTFTAVCQSTAFDGITTMQQMTPTICKDAPVGISSTLTDNRDSNTYTVKKLKDGNCWMTQNLRLNSPSKGYINSSDSDVNSQISWSTIAATTSCSGANSCTYYDSNYPNNGGYYSWYAATAGSGTVDMVYPEKATYSICPKGWKLPSDDKVGEFGILYNYYNSWDAMLTDSDGPQFIRAAYRTYDYMANISYGYYWSNTAAPNSLNAYNLLFFDDGVSVRLMDSTPKYSGQNIRCLARNQSGTLTVDPNGGTWNNSPYRQNFTQDSGTTKAIPNPTIDDPETYTISYNDNGQGASYSSEPTAIAKSSSWSLYGDGTYAGGTYGFGAGNGTLVAQYNNTTSDSFVLPIITKSGHRCFWAEGDPGNTQYAGGSSRTITRDTTYYAVCVNNFTVNITNSNTTSGSASINVPVGGSTTVTVTPSSGYYLSAVTCPANYTCSGYSTGSSYTGTQTVTVSEANDEAKGGTLTFTGTALTLAQTCTNASTGATFTYSGKQYIKLKTNSAGTTTACYTKSSQGAATYANAPSLCPSGTSIPSQTDFSNLTSAYGTSSALNTATGWGPSSSYTYYWTSTTYTSGYNYALRIRTSAANITYRTTSSSSGVLCKVN